MRSLNITDCGCESGEHFKCYCQEVKESNQTKFRKRLSSCKNFIKTRTKKTSYGNVEENSEQALVRSHSLNLSAYTIKKDLKDLLHITSKKVLVQQEFEGSHDSSGSKTPESLQNSNDSINNNNSRLKGRSLPNTTTRPTSQRRDSNESIDRRFEIIIPS